MPTSEETRARKEELELRELEARDAERSRAEAEKRAQEERKREEERQRQQAEFFANISHFKPTSKWFWIVLLILVIVLFFLWWRGLLGKVIAYVIPVIIGILFLVIIIWGFRDKGENSRYIAFAFIIWGMDLIPQGLPLFGWLGPPYAGFKFEVIGLLNTNWVAVLFSIVFMAALLFGTIRDLFRKNYWAVLISLGIFLFLNRFFKDYLLTNLPYTSTWLNWGILGAIIITFVLAFQFREKLPEQFVDYLTYLFLILTASFFWINDFWINIPRAWLHVAFILYFGFIYIRKKEQDNPSTWHLLIPAFLISDFFVYNLLLLGSAAVADGLQFIPILIIIVLWYCISKTPESRYAFYSILFIFLIIIAFVLPTYAFPSESTVFEARKGADYKEFYTQFKDKLSDVIEGRLDIATAGLYRGNVEKNRYESLGVYFANLRAADPRFYTDEPITVWGTIRSKTYKDAVIINFSCYRFKDNKRIKADKIVPDTKFPIFTLEEVDTECTFLSSKGKEVPVGSNTVTFSAEYNFGTDAYLKAYFIDRDRYRAYVRENVDPFKEFGIKDTKPASVSTNGPVEIGIAAGPLITVSQGYTVKPSIGITLTNRQEIQDKDKNIITRWEGKIKNITELILLVPPGIELPNIDACKESKDSIKRLDCPCSMPFEPYDIHKCFTSCSLQILEPCNSVCEISYSKNQNLAENCVKECVTTFDKCNEECKFLFEVGEGEGPAGNYKGYALDVGSLQFRDLNKDIDKHRSFLCRFDPSPNVLDKNPITTRYFRVRARYNYLLENSVTVNVESPPVGTGLTAPESLFDNAVKFSKDISDLQFTGFNPDFIVAIASVESGLKHCCQEGYGGRGTTCSPSSEKKCPKERTITSGTSYGMMQVRYDTAKVQSEVNKLVAKYCTSGETIFDFDCNIKVGMSILKNKYDIYKNGCKGTTEYKSGDTKKYPTLINACNGCTSTIDGTPYSSYREFDAALRGYNGWGCDSRFDKGYVEKVKRSLGKIKNGKMAEDIKELLSSREGEGMVDQESSIKPAPPTNPNAIDTPSARNSITISWNPSPTPGVNYLVYRYTPPSDVSTVSYTTIQTSYVDIDVQDGVNYYYRITAYNDYDESDPAQTNPIKSVDDTTPPTQGTP